MVQKLQQARRDLVLESAIAKLDKFHLLILDDITYVTKDQADSSVLFELISARYERRSMLITANQPFGEWNSIFPDSHPDCRATDVKYLPQMQDATSRRYLIAAIDRATRWVFIGIYRNKTAANARRFLRDLERACPLRIRTILTDNGK